MSPVNTNNYMNFAPSNTFQPYQPAQYFPQPQGSIYMIGSSNEVANVPVGTGLSAAICLREGIVYLKTIQNGSPMLLGYKLSPLEGNPTQEQSNIAATPQNQSQEHTIEQRIMSMLEGFDKRLKELEGASKSKGGTEKWQL